VNSEKFEGAEESPRVLPKKKLKEHDANKGIKISENLSMPSMDDVSSISFSFFSYCRAVKILCDSPLLICSATDSP
jgi:hypothetical protein